MAKLPSGYTEVEWIGRNGNNYIDTGWVPNTTTGFEVKIGYKIPTGGKRYTILANYNAIKNDVSFEINSGGQTSNKIRYYIEQNNVDLFSSNTMSVGAFNDIVLTSGGNVRAIKLKGTATTKDSNSRGTSGTSAYLFIDRKLRWDTFTYDSQISYCQIWEGENLIKDFIPAIRNSDNEIGMYDLVSGTFYSNLGTGTFSAGPVVSANPYIQLEYIGRNGNNYIDTGWVPNTTEGYEVKVGYKISTSGKRYGVVSNYSSNGTCPMSLEVYDNNKARFYTAYSGEGYEIQSTNSIDTSSFNNIVFTSNGNSSGSINLNGTITEGEIYTTDYYKNTAYLFIDRDFRWSVFNNNSYISYCKIYENDTLVRDLIPVKRKSDGLVCMYDLVEERFYLNLGSGTFSAGPEKITLGGKCNISIASVKGGSLIPGYTMLQYIESTGTQYIDTGMDVGGGTYVETKFYGGNIIFGARRTWNTSAYSLNNNNVNYAFNFGNISTVSTLTTTIPLEPAAWHTCSIDNGFATLDSWSRQFSTGTFGAPGTLVLFGLKTNGVIELDVPMKMAYFKLSEPSLSEELDLVPVIRNSDGKVGMYDRVNDVFYTNAGSGEFIAGPKI